MHFEGQEAGSLLSPGQNLLNTRAPSHPASPWLGRTPGPAVVQEGRLSLEMLSQQLENDGRNGTLAPAPEPLRESIAGKTGGQKYRGAKRTLLAFKDNHKLVRKRLPGLILTVPSERLAGLPGGLPPVITHNKQPLNLPSTKLTPPTLLAGIADHLNMKVRCFFSESMVSPSVFVNLTMRPVTCRRPSRRIYFMHFLRS